MEKVADDTSVEGKTEDGKITKKGQRQYQQHKKEQKTCI